MLPEPAWPSHAESAVVAVILSIRRLVPFVLAAVVSPFRYQSAEQSREAGSDFRAPSVPAVGHSRIVCSSSSGATSHSRRRPTTRTGSVLEQDVCRVAVWLPRVDVVDNAFTLQPTESVDCQLADIRPIHPRMMPDRPTPRGTDQEFASGQSSRLPCSSSATNDRTSRQLPRLEDESKQRPGCRPTRHPREGPTTYAHLSANLPLVAPLPRQLAAPPSPRGRTRVAGGELPPRRERRRQRSSEAIQAKTRAHPNDAVPTSPRGPRTRP